MFKPNLFKQKKTVFFLKKTIGLNLNHATLTDSIKKDVVEIWIVPERWMKAAQDRQR